MFSGAFKIIIYNSIGDILGESSFLLGSFGGCRHVFTELFPD